MIEHVYFLLDESKNRIRIGKTDNLLRRLLQHQDANGFRLKLLGVTEGGYEREQEIQVMFPALSITAQVSRATPHHPQPASSKRLASIRHHSGVDPAVLPMYLDHGW